jgi:hypothetical protein
MNKSPGTKIVPRDIELLRSLFESRIMTRVHLAALHFDGSVHAATKRVQKLLDRSSENLDRLAVRASCYRDYYFHGGFAVRNGAGRDQFKEFPFRALFVLQNDERRNNTAERMLLLPNPIRDHSWLTTYRDVATDPLGAIWTTPHAYHRVTRGTKYDLEHRRGVVGYSRSAERETLVEAALTKQPLLE